MTAAVLFILYVVSAGNLPDFTALAAFDTQAKCEAAATSVNAALAAGEDTKHAACLSSSSLAELAAKNGVAD